MENRSDKTPPFELQPPKKIPPKNDNPPFYHKLLSVQLCTQTHTEELACLDSLEYSLKYLHFFRESAFIPELENASSNKWVMHLSME